MFLLKLLKLKSFVKAKVLKRSRWKEADTMSGEIARIKIIIAIINW